MLTSDPDEDSSEDTNGFLEVERSCGPGECGLFFDTDLPPGYAPQKQKIYIIPDQIDRIKSNKNSNVLTTVPLIVTVLLAKRCIVASYAFK